MVGVDWLGASAKEVLISEVCFKEIVSTGEQFSSSRFSRIPHQISSEHYFLLVNDRQKELAEAVESKYKAML